MRRIVPFCLFALACRPGDARIIDIGTDDYCEIPAFGGEVLQVRPDSGEAPIDDVNWFARPVPHDGSDWIVAFASHNQNYLYNLTEGRRIKVPDRSDAVATPDGRYLTVPSNYTPDSTVRFYDLPPLLAALARGEDADDFEPAYIHRHPGMTRVYYQSTAVVGEETTAAGTVTTYRLMFSGTGNDSRFRIADYRFTHDGAGSLQNVHVSEPFRLCPEVRNDLNTPFISKDGRYVAAYTADTSGFQYSPGASLKIFEITSVDSAAGTASCRPVANLGFTAGKADFSFDGSMLTFHTSQGAYLTPFINGGLPATTITDIVVAQLTRDEAGAITGHAGLQRLTTSLEAGVGSYFPAFLPDGAVFFIANAVPKESEAEKRFHFRVLEPRADRWRSPTAGDAAAREGWSTLAGLWERSCRSRHPTLAHDPFPLQPHEAPWLGLSLSERQCRALVEDARAADGPETREDWSGLLELCGSLAP